MRGRRGRRRGGDHRLRRRRIGHAVAAARIAGGLAPRPGRTGRDRPPSRTCGRRSPIPERAASPSPALTGQPDAREADAVRIVEEALGAAGDRAAGVGGARRAVGRPPGRGRPGARMLAVAARQTEAPRARRCSARSRPASPRRRPGPSLSSPSRRRAPRSRGHSRGPFRPDPWFMMRGSAPDRGSRTGRLLPQGGRLPATPIPSSRSTSACHAAWWRCPALKLAPRTPSRRPAGRRRRRSRPRHHRAGGERGAARARPADQHAPRGRQAVGAVEGRVVAGRRSPAAARLGRPPRRPRPRAGGRLLEGVGPRRGRRPRLAGSWARSTAS